MDQARFKLLSGSSSLDCLAVGDYESVRDIMEQRLFGVLCLTATPTVGTGSDIKVDPLWEQLLAEALAVSLNVQQDDGLDSESMRNYSYHFRDYANSWAMLSKKCPDLLNKFNACSVGVTMQRDDADWIYGFDPYGNPYGFRYRYDYYDNL